VAGSSNGTATHAQVSPLMLTPERIHAGVVLVDMQGAAAAPSHASQSYPSSRCDSCTAGLVGPVTVTSVSSSAGIVRGRFIIYNSTTSRSGVGHAGGSSGRVSVVFGQQSKNTLTSPFVPPHQRAVFHFRPARP
jgi:hypothetical protein